MTAKLAYHGKLLKKPESDLLYSLKIQVTPWKSRVKFTATQLICVGRSVSGIISLLNEI